MKCDGLALTSPVRTLLDLAAQLPLIDLVVVIDAALKKRTCTLEQLSRALKTAVGEAWPDSDARSSCAMAAASRLWRR